MLRRPSSLVGLSFLVACGSHVPSQPAAGRVIPPRTAGSAAVAVDAPPVAPTATAEPTLPVPSPPTVTLLQAGAEPRRQLRYAFGLQRETAQIDLKMSIAMRTGARAAPIISMPTFRITIETRPTRIRPDGTLEASEVIKKAEVLREGQIAPGLVEKFTPQLEQLVGMKGTMVITTRGVLLAMDMEEMAPDTADSVHEIADIVVNSIHDFGTPLPEEPVGRGARWEVKSAVAGGAGTVERTTYTAKALTDKTAALEVTLSRGTPPDTPPSAAPADASTRLVSHEASGAGTIAISLEQLTPTWTMTTSSRSHLVMLVGSEQQAAATDMTLHLAVKPFRLK